MNRFYVLGPLLTGLCGLALLSAPCTAQDQLSARGKGNVVSPKAPTDGGGQGGVAGGCPSPAPVTASCTPDVAVPGGLISSVPFNGLSPLAITIRSDGGAAATIWAPGLFDGTTYVYDQALAFQGSFPSPTGLATTTGIAYDPVNGTLWYINVDNLTIVEANLAGVATGNVITCVPTANGGGLPAGLCYNPDGDGGSGTFLYNDIIVDDIFEITRTGGLVSQIPKSCADDGAGGAAFGNGIDCTCNGIEVLVGSSSFGTTERAVLIDPVTGEDAGAATELFTVTGDTFINGIVRHPTAPSTRLYVVGSATNTLFIINPADLDTEECLPPECPADLDGSGDVGVKDLLILLGAWGDCPK